MKWIKVKLTDISKPKQWKNLPLSEMSEEGFLVYGANGIIGKYKEYNHEFPTLAITCRGATCGTLNITEPKSYITSNAMALDGISENVNQKFLYYALKKRGFKDIITGAAQPQITGEGLSKIILNIPENLSDQIQIANILSKAETLIEQRKQSIALLDEFLKSTFLEMFGDPAFNEKQWEKFQLQDLIAKGDKINYGVVQPGEDGNKTGIEIIRVGDFEGIKINSKNLKLIDAAIEQKHKASRLIGDEVLLACVGATIGKIAMADNSHKGYNIVRAVARVRCNSEKLNRLYLCQLLLTSYYQFNLKNLARTVAQPTLNIKQIEELKIPVPPIELQTQFATIVTKTETLKEQYKNSLQELENLYGSLSQQAFKGELKVKALSRAE